MTILLVGGAGFIGKRFIRKYSSLEKVAVYATKDDIKENKEFLESNSIKNFTGSVEEDRLHEVVKNIKPKVVIHLAALTGLSKCHKDPLIAFQTNVYGTYNVVSACNSIGSKLIFISSREIYGETVGQKTSESDPPLPNNVYGITKMVGENIVQYFNQKFNLDFTILRLTNVYGPEGDQYGAQVIIKNAITTKKVQILGGNQRLNYIFVDDVIKIIYECIKNPLTSKEIFNVGSIDTVSIKEFVDEVILALNEKIVIDYKPMRETETANFEPDLKKLEKFFGLPPTSLKDGIKKTIEWYKQF